MKEEQDYIQDITEIRSMMERSSKFLSLSGWAGVMAGIYALTGAWLAYALFQFNPNDIRYTGSSDIDSVIFLATLILILAIGTAVVLSSKKAAKRGEQIWNATSRRLITSMSVPLVTGGVLLLILLSKGFIGLIAPLTLLFYGLALYNAGKFTINEVTYLGYTQIGLGLISSYYIEYGLLLWAVGFGVVHIGYGIYIHIKYER